MARKKKKPRQGQTPIAQSRERSADKQQKVEPGRSRWHVHLLGVLLLLVQLVVLPGAASPFRTPKDTLLLAGLAVIVALGLAGRLKRGQLSYPRSRLIVVLAVLPVLQAMSVLWSDDPYRALSSAGRSAIWVAAIAWIATLEKPDRDRLLAWCTAGAGVSGVVLLLQTAGLQMFDIVGPAGRNQLTGLAGNPSDFAMTAGMLLPLLLLSVQDRSRRISKWIMIGVLLLAIIASVSLTGVAAVGLLAMVWLARNRSPRVWLAAVGVVVVVAALGWSTGLQHRVREARTQVLNGNWYAMFSARGDGWTAATEMVRGAPVTGVGAGNYTQRFYPARLEWLTRHHEIGKRGEQASHFGWAHCDPLQHVAELGILGALWLVALFWAVARAAPKQPYTVALAAAATVPFLLLHYPTHLSLGLIPISLILAAVASVDGAGVVEVRAAPLRWGVGAVAVAIALLVVWSQLERMAIDVWKAGLNRRIVLAQRVQDPRLRRQAIEAVETNVRTLIDRVPGEAPWLWRTLGKAQVIDGKPREAEQSFRRAFELWPHAEAEFGIGISLANQGRRSEALVHLARVCRINPVLHTMIDDEDLVRGIKDMLGIADKSWKQQ